jgi:hypothetical protein
LIEESQVILMPARANARPFATIAWKHAGFRLFLTKAKYVEMREFVAGRMEMAQNRLTCGGQISRPLAGGWGRGLDYPGEAAEKNFLMLFSIGDG